MSEQNDAERTEAATPRRLEQAREEGNVARSQELTTFAMLMAGSAGLWWMGAGLFDAMSALVKRGLQLDPVVASDPAFMTSRLGELAMDGLFATAPLLGVLAVVALAAPQLLSGWNFSVKALHFDFERINPVNGIGRIFSMRSLAELVKALIKAILVTAVSAVVIWHYRDALLQITLLPPVAAVAEAARVAGLSFLIIAAALAVIAVADVPYQLWQHADELKMSHEDLRQEHKESEGDPQIKQAIRNQQREMARRRMMAEVPKASVIVTNPTHYAVALSYENNMRAPRVVAKGADLIAARIRDIGQEHHVPVLESPALARAIYHHTEIGAEIPETLYTSVAEVLAYVFQLRRHREYGDPTPLPLHPVAVPAGLDPQEASR